MIDIAGLGISRVDTEALPPGRAIDLPGRGTTFACESPGPPGAPTLILLHGLACSGYLNWFPAFPALRERFHVVAMDMRGHGRGIDPRGRFRLADCADDVVALADALEVDRFIPVGYSLGGPVAQLTWRRHPERVAGLVLCATSRNFGGTRRERNFYRTLLGGVAAIRLAHVIRRGRAPEEEPDDAPLPDGFDGAFVHAWAMRELGQNHTDALLAAMNAMGRFSSHQWIEDVDVPTAVVVTTKDRFIAPVRQLKLARAIVGATVHECAAGHAACVLGRAHFVPALVEACQSVADRLVVGAAV